MNAQQFEQLVRYKFNGDILAASKFFKGPYYGEFNYAFREVVAERLAYNRVERYLGEMPNFDVADTLNYLERYRKDYLPFLP